MLTAIVLILFALTTAPATLPHIKSRPKKETAAYGLLWVCALTVLFLYSIGLQVPSPTDAIRSAVNAIFPPK